MLLQLFRTHRSSSSSSSSTLMPPLSILRSTRSTSTTGTTGVPKKFLAVPYPYHAEVKVQVQSLNAQGLGVGVAVDPQHPARTRTIHVPKVWPGEVVIARIYRNVAGSNVSEADLVRVEVPSPERVQPICRYYSSCSGCQLQHVGIEAQHLWKRQQVLDGLKATGCDLSKAELNEVISTAPEHTHAYRSKITPQVSYHKIRKEDGSLIDRVDDVETYANRALRIGFQIVNSRRVLDIDECILATKDVNDELHSFREKMTRTHEKNSALAVAIPRKKRRMQLLSSQLFRDDLRGSVHSDPNALITQNVSGLNFTYKAGEFFQVNPYILPALVSYVVTEAKSGGCRHLIDAYCGSGLFSLSAAEHFSSVTGIEISQMAVQAAQRNAVANDIRNVNFIWGKAQTLFDEVKSLEDKACRETAVIIDPSRKGCDISFLTQLLAYSPRKIVYVSCNPATQARDVVVLTSNDYVISRVTPFDMFPQTKHIECVITLTNKNYNEACGDQ